MLLKVCKVFRDLKNCKLLLSLSTIGKLEGINLAKSVNHFNSRNVTSIQYMYKGTSIFPKQQFADKSWQGCVL